MNEQPLIEVTIGGQRLMVPAAAPNGRTMTPMEATQAYMLTGKGSIPAAAPAPAPSMSSSTPAPPPGFVIEQALAPASSSAVTAPEPPPGFILEGGDSKSRYDLALGKVRQSQFPEMTDEQWQGYSQTTFAPSLKAQGDQATTLGFSDEISAAMGGFGSQVRQWTGGGGKGFSDSYGDLYELEQARLALAREHNGGLGTALEVAGGMATLGPARTAIGAIAAPVVAQGGNAAVNAVKTAIPAAAGGAVYGFGSTDGNLEERALGAGIGSLIGTGASVLAPVAGKVIEGTARTIGNIPAARAAQQAITQAIKSAPSAAMIKAGSKAAYKASEQTGAEIGQAAMGLFQRDAKAILQAEGLILASGNLSRAYPKVSAAVDAIDEYAGEQITIPQARTLLRSLRLAQKSIDPDEARLGSMLVDQFEDFMDALPPSAFPRGNGTQAIEEWSKGRSDWARFRRTSTIEGIIEKATRAKGGFEAGLRAGFNGVLNSAKKQRGFNAEELDLMRRFVAGGPVNDFLGALAGGSSLPAAMTGHLFGGPAGGIVAAGGRMAAGAAAKAGLNQGAQKAAEKLRAAVATPGGLPAPFSPPASLSNLERLALPGGMGSGAAANDPRDSLTNLLMLAR